MKLSTNELVSISAACVVLTMLALFDAPSSILIPIAGVTVIFIGFTLFRNHAQAKKKGPHQ